MDHKGTFDGKISLRTLKSLPPFQQDQNQKTSTFLPLSGEVSAVEGGSGLGMKRVFKIFGDKTNVQLRNKSPKVRQRQERNPAKQREKEEIQLKIEEINSLLVSHRRSMNESNCTSPRSLRNTGEISFKKIDISEQCPSGNSTFQEGFHFSSSQPIFSPRKQPGYYLYPTFSLSLNDQYDLKKQSIEQKRLKRLQELQQHNEKMKEKIQEKVKEESEYEQERSLRVDEGENQFYFQNIKDAGSTIQAPDTYSHYSHNTTVGEYLSPLSVDHS